ncbi:MAG: hypothetical protein R3A10_03655 [Caldilineaceae bacterium]
MALATFATPFTALSLVQGQRLAVRVATSARADAGDALPSPRHRDLFQRGGAA